jgi:hypothetical protein
MGQRRRAFELGQLRTLDAGVAAPKGLELLQQHGPDLIFGPPGRPRVFNHTATIQQNLFIVNEILDTW